MGLNTVEYKNDFNKIITPILKSNGFKCKIDKDEGLTYLNEFKLSKIRLRFSYDIRDNFFYYSVIYGKKTIFQNSKNKPIIIPLVKLLIKNDSNINLNDLQPNNKQYLTSLELIALLLKQNINDIINKKY